MFVPPKTITWKSYSSYYRLCSGCPMPGARIENRAATVAAHEAWHQANGQDTATPWLPVDLPKTTGKPVFEVYYPAMPVSLDNATPGPINFDAKQFGVDYWGANYINPDGEGGAHKTIGGWCRDRPLPRSAISGDWRLDDARAEVAHARARGINGFLLNIMTYPGQHPWQHEVCKALVKAAAETPDFRVWLMLDMTSGGTTAITKAQVAAFLKELVGYGGCYMVGGKLALSAFSAERQAPAWYVDMFAAIRFAIGLDTWFFPCFQNTDANYQKFIPISAGWFEWGDRNPAWNDPSPTGARRRRINDAHAAGKLFYQAVSIQDERPREGIFDECNNTENLRVTCQIGREGNADGMIFIARNDYTEGTVFAPSVKHGDVYADLMAIEAAWFRSGRLNIVRDGLYLTHRTQFHAAKPSYPQTKLMMLRGGSPARDTAEALVFLREPATVEVQSGGNTKSYDVGAGRHPLTCGLGLGFVSARIKRGGQTVLEVKSPHEVKAPWVQDLQYVAAGKVAA